MDTCGHSLWPRDFRLMSGPGLAESSGSSSLAPQHIATSLALTSGAASPSKDGNWTLTDLQMGIREIKMLLDCRLQHAAYVLEAKIHENTNMECHTHIYRARKGYTAGVRHQ